MVKFQTCTTKVKAFKPIFLALKPFGALWHPVKISLAKINLQRTSLISKNLKSTQYSLFWIIFEGCGVLCSSLGNIFLLFRPKNPRSRSRWMCSYFMKNSRFLHGLSTLQRVLVHHHRLRRYSWMTDKNDCYEVISTT